jgi:hypothetical protein
MVTSIGKMFEAKATPPINGENKPIKRNKTQAVLNALNLSDDIKSPPLL